MYHGLDKLRRQRLELRKAKKAIIWKTEYQIRIIYAEKELQISSWGVLLFVCLNFRVGIDDDR